MSAIVIHRASTRGGQRAGTVVYAPYPWAANESNAYHRYEAIAERSGFDVVVGHVPGTGRVIIDRATRRSLRPANFGDFIELTTSHAEAVAKAVGSYAVRIGLGDSARGVWISTMQLSEARPFTHVLIRDGINLTGQRLLRGLSRGIHSGSSLGDTTIDVLVRPPQSAAQNLRNGACALSEAWSWRRVLGSAMGMEAAERLAGNVSIPFHSIALGYGIGGSAEQAVAFNTKLKGIRQTGVEQSEGLSTITPFLDTFEPTWGHGNLCDPDGAVTHLRLTAAL